MHDPSVDDHFELALRRLSSHVYYPRRACRRGGSTTRAARTKRRTRTSRRQGEVPLGTATVLQPSGPAGDAVVFPTESRQAKTSGDPRMG